MKLDKISGLRIGFQNIMKSHRGLDVWQKAMREDGRIIEVPTFLSWPQSYRLRWPFARQASIPSPLADWFATGVQIRANMQTAQMADGRYILVENEEEQDAAQIQIGQQQDFPEMMARHDVKQRWFYRARNARQAWDKFGNEVAL